MRNVTEIQQQLITLKYLPEFNDKGERNADGTFGRVSLDAYNRWRAAQPVPLPPVTKPNMTQLNADLFPEERPAVVVPTHNPSIFDQIGTLMSLISLLKGKTMTADQIGGIVRAILTFLAGLAVAKGWVDNATALTIVGGLVTVLTAAWSVFTNRPSKVVKT